MIITKKAIPRRTLLRGIGAALALPTLDEHKEGPQERALDPKRSSGATVPRPYLRFSKCKTEVCGEFCWGKTNGCVFLKKVGATSWFEVAVDPM